MKFFFKTVKFTSERVILKRTYLLYLLLHILLFSSQCACLAAVLKTELRHWETNATSLMIWRFLLACKILKISFIDKCLADSNGSGVIAKLLPAVTGSVTTTAAKMQFCQKEELVWHHVIGIRHRYGLWTPVYCNTFIFVTWTISMLTWNLMISIWQKREQTVGSCATVFKLDYVPVRFEALSVVVTCNWSWKDTKKDIFLHEVI